MTSFAASQGICDWIRSVTLPPILEGRSVSGERQLAQMPGSEGRRGRLEAFGIHSTRLLRLQCYADPHILLPNCSWADRSTYRIFTAPPGSPGQHVSKAGRGEQRREVIRRIDCPRADGVPRGIEVGTNEPGGRPRDQRVS